MPLFKITTRSTFENVYLIEADSDKEALNIVDLECIDFFQKHLAEEPIACIDVDTFEGLADELRKLGYA